MSALREFIQKVVKVPDAAPAQAQGDMPNHVGQPSAVPGAPPTVAPVSSIKIEPVPASIATEGQYQLHAKGTTAAGDKPDVTKSVTWSSADETIATVDQNGLVTAKSIVKTVKITAKDKNDASIQDTLDFNVIPRVVKAVWVDYQHDKLRLVGGGSLKVWPWVTYTDGSSYRLTEGYVWSTSNRKVISVGSDGVVASEGIGRANVIVTHEASGKRGEREVVVEPPGPGARKINVQIMVNNFDDKPILGGTGLVSFKKPGAEDVQLGGEFKQGLLSFANVILMPEGSMHLNGWGYTEAARQTLGTASYKLPAGELLTFQATQKRETQTTKAGSAEEAAKNVGAAGKRYEDYEAEQVDKDQWTVKWGDNSWIVKQV